MAVTNPGEFTALSEPVMNVSWLELTIRMARENYESFDLLCNVADVFPLDETSLSGDDEMNLRNVVRFVRVVEPEAVDDDEDN